jgi:hypothetical protein
MITVRKDEFFLGALGDSAVNNEKINRRDAEDAENCGDRS